LCRIGVLRKQPLFFLFRFRKTPQKFFFFGVLKKTPPPPPPPRNDRYTVAS